MPLQFTPSTLADELTELVEKLSEYNFESEDLESYLGGIKEPDDYEETIDESSVFCFTLPYADTTIDINTAQIRNLAEELSTAKLEGGLECLTSRRFFLRVALIFDDQNPLCGHLFYHTPEESLSIEFTDNGNKITCKIVSGITLFNIMVARHMHYDKYLPPSLAEEFFVEVSFSNPIAFSDARKIAHSYLFELYSSLDLTLEPDPRPEFFQVPEYDEPLDISEIRIRRPILGKGISEVQSLYMKAAYADDPEIQLLFYVKVIEFISQTVIRKETNERILLKLHSPDALHPNSIFVKNLEDAFDELRSLRKDKAAIRQTLLNCCDFSEILNHLPPFPAKKIGKSRGDEAVSVLSNIIVSTRNDIAHAKTGYTPTGFECPANELGGLCKVLKICARQAIYWFKDQGDNLRMV
ncbi:hypothetical protein [Fundidesulfovibrio putealis]|uniref:hypothetical protein n=1 Tax=Fundidesulfovibrio putealis TaxID=270496 RepID=UPI0004101601|nr:hypothetical protein [Fundidesulfovibrio putealis]